MTIAELKADTERLQPPFTLETQHCILAGEILVILNPAGENLGAVWIEGSKLMNEIGYLGPANRDSLLDFGNHLLKSGSNLLNPEAPSTKVMTNGELAKHFASLPPDEPAQIAVIKGGSGSVDTDNLQLLTFDLLRGIDLEVPDEDYHDTIDRLLGQPVLYQE